MPAGSYQTFSSTRTLHLGRVLLTHDPLIHFVLISQRIPFILKIFWSQAADKQLRYPGARCGQEAPATCCGEPGANDKMRAEGRQNQCILMKVGTLQRSRRRSDYTGPQITPPHLRSPSHGYRELHPLGWWEEPGCWVPAAACKFMLIEPQEMWEHFLLAFNKHKQISLILYLPSELIQYCQYPSWLILLYLGNISWITFSNNKKFS